MQGCGYHIGGVRPELAAGIKTVSIPLFSNATQETRIENVLTEAFRDQFSRLSSVRVVSRKEDADAVLHGRVTSASLEPVSFDAAFNVLEYTARVTVSLELRSTRDNTVLWAADRLEESQSFKVISDALVFSDNREEAYLKIALRIAEKALTRMLAGF
jgi:TolB-like protein